MVNAANTARPAQLRAIQAGLKKVQKYVSSERFAELSSPVGTVAEASQRMANIETAFVMLAPVSVLARRRG